MTGTRDGASVNRILVGVSLLLILCQPVKAERLPIKTYTTADGLAHNNINRIVRDSRGFLWFCTFEGLSHFDGYSFTTYGVGHGLPSQVINDLLETREGQYWVATDAGLCRFNPKGIPGQHATNGTRESATAPNVMFAVYLPGEDAKSKQVTALLQDRAGVIWCGTARGLYRLEERYGQVEFHFVELGMPNIYGEAKNVTSMIEDQRGALWIGSENGVYRLLPDGTVKHYGECQGWPLNLVHSLLEDREGSVWVATESVSLCRLVPDPDPARPVGARAYSVKDGLPIAAINQLFQPTDGSLWAASTTGLIRFISTADGGEFRFRVYGQPHGLSSQSVQALAEDRSGNLWIGMANGGAAKLARSGITSYGEADGFKSARAIFKDRSEALNVITVPNEEQYLINRFDGERFTAIQLKLLKLSYFFGWGWNQLVLEDRAGEWWVATGHGLYRFPRVSSSERLVRTPPKAAYTTRDGLASNDILRLFEDSHGRIWVGTANLGGLSRWDPATETFHHYTEQDGLPSLVNFYPISFAEDRAGNIWIGFSVGGGLVRYRDGRFTRFTAEDGLAEGGIFNLLVDSADRLWTPTTRGGVCRIDHPEAERPTILTYTTADGLSSNDVKAVTEDRWGRIYLGTGRGIDRLDPASGHIRHYTANEGALLGDVNAALQDRDGALWFSYGTGLVRLVPEPDLQPIPPPILLTGLRIAGDTYLVSALGETEIAPIELAANKNELQIDFVALGFSPGEELRYQYKLEGADDDWRLLTDQRTVNFANLAPATYRFLVRAVNADGVMSEHPASFSFTISPPLWRRWWFLTLSMLAIALAAFMAYRYRVSRLLELERIRTRIAADLHDDIGANLIKITILSEVVDQQLERGGKPERATVLSIAEISRESAASMRDIVWAINPKRDRLLDLSRRMRGFASDIFTSRNIQFQFHAPDRDRDLRLGPEVRRDVFLIFKEAISNVVRHSGCAEAVIQLSVEGGELVLTVSDDGEGFVPGGEDEGHGLDSMRRRAEGFGGKLEVGPNDGRGTTVLLRVPIFKRR